MKITFEKDELSHMESVSKNYWATLTEENAVKMEGTMILLYVWLWMFVFESDTNYFIYSFDKIDAL